jgi:hypothetical protein
MSLPDPAKMFADFWSAQSRALVQAREQVVPTTPIRTKSTSQALMALRLRITNASAPMTRRAATARRAAADHSSDCLEASWIIIQQFSKAMLR